MDYGQFENSVKKLVNFELAAVSNRKNKNKIKNKINKEKRQAIGHFRVPKTLTLKTRPSAILFLVKMSFICMIMKKK